MSKLVRTRMEIRFSQAQDDEEQIPPAPPPYFEIKGWQYRQEFLTKHPVRTTCSKKLPKIISLHFHKAFEQEAQGWQFTVGSKCQPNVDMTER